MHVLPGFPPGSLVFSHFAKAVTLNCLLDWLQRGRIDSGPFPGTGMLPLQFVWLQKKTKAERRKRQEKKTDIASAGLLIRCSFIMSSHHRQLIQPYSHFSISLNFKSSAYILYPRLQLPLLIKVFPTHRMIKAFVK